MLIKRSIDYWNNHIVSFTNSGLTQSEYCKQHKLDPSYFSKQRRNKIIPKSNSKNLSEFVEIKQTKEKASVVTLSIANKYFINVEQEFDHILLNNLLNLLESRL